MQRAVQTRVVIHLLVALILACAAAMLQRPALAGGLPEQEGPRGCPPDLNDPHLSDPVILATERFTRSHVDLSLDIPGGVLEFGRTYRSVEYRPRNINWQSPPHALGPNWRHSFEMDFRIMGDNEAVWVVDGDGRVDRFDVRLPYTTYPPTCPPSGRIPLACPGRDEVLEIVVIPDGCPCNNSAAIGPAPVEVDWQNLSDFELPIGADPPNWGTGCQSLPTRVIGIRMVRADGSETYYSRITTLWRDTFRPEWSITPERVRLSYFWDSCNRLSEIVAESGQWIRLTYAADYPPAPPAPAQCSDRLIAIEDVAGRRVEYAYYAAGEADSNAGDLKSVTMFGLPGDAPRVWRYAYQSRSENVDFEDDSKLTSIVDPRGHTEVVNAYTGEHDQIAKQIRYGDSRYDYHYALGTGEEDDYSSYSVNRDGQVRELRFVDRYSENGPRMRAMIEYAGRIPENQRDTCLSPSCLSAVLATRIDANGQPMAPRVTTYFYTDEDDANDTGYDDEVRIREVIFPDGSREKRWYNFDRTGAAGTPFPPGFPTAGLVRHFWAGLLWKVERTGLAPESGGPPPVTVEEYEHDYVNGGGSFASGCLCGPGRPNVVTDAAGAITRFEYSGSLVTKITHPNVPGPGGTASPVEEFQRSGGRLVRRLHPMVDGARREDVYEYGSVWLYAPDGLQIERPSVHPTTVRLGVVGGQAQMTRAYEYDIVGNLTRVIDSDGDDSVFTYNGFREVTQIQSRPGPGGARVSTWLVYDLMGNLVRSDTENRDQNGVLSASNPTFTTLREYDAKGRLRRVAVEAVDAVVPPNVTVLAGVPEPSKFAVTEYWYNAEDMLTEVRGPAVKSGLDAGAVVRMEFDEWNQLYRVSRGLGAGSSITQFDYDGSGNLTRVVEGAGGAAALPRITQYVPDGLGRVTRIIRPDGTTVEQEFDPVGNVIKSVVKGQIEAGVGPNVVLAQSEFEFDAMGRPAFAQYRLFDPVEGLTPSSPALRTSYLFNQDSSLRTVTDPMGRQTQFTYDRIGRLDRQTDALGNTTELGYDPNGNLAVQLTRQINGLDPTNAAAVRTTKVEFVHDALDRLSQVRRFTGTNDFSLSQFHYDSRGNLVEAFDPRSKRTRVVYDALSRPLQTRRLLDNGSEIVTSQVWDIASRLIAQIDDNGNATRYAYDSQHRLVAIRHADGMIRQVGEGMVWPDGAAAPSAWGTPGFDALGNALVMSAGRAGGRVRVVSTPDINGAVVARDITYLDENNRTANERAVFDGLGRLRRAWARDDALESHSMVARRYDSLSRLLSDSIDFEPQAFPSFNASIPGTVSYGYTDAGQVSRVVYPGGREVHWQHDELHRVKAIHDIVPNAGGGTAAVPLAWFDYAGPARLIRRINGNGTMSRWSHNGLLGPGFASLPAGDPDAPPVGDFGFGRVTRVSHAMVPTQGVPVPATFDDWTLTWDRSNNKTSRIQLGTTGIGGNFAPAHAMYGYDAIDRLVSALVTVPGEEGSKDPRWRDEETYALDGVHNRVSTTGGASPGAYSLGASGSLTRAMNQYAASPLSQFTHDARGNMRSESAHCRGDIAPAQPSGEVGDHQVNIADMTRMLGQMGQPVVQGPPPPVGTGNAECDINGDGAINVGDLTVLLGNFGAGCDWTEYRYDWADRLVEVRASSWANGQGSANGPSRVEVHRYQYDALGRRIARTLFATGSVSPGGGLTTPRCTRFIYGGVGDAGDALVGWQVLEERDGSGGPGGGRTLATFVPSGRYVDETVCFRRDLAGSGLFDNQGSQSGSPEPVCGPPPSAAATQFAEFWLNGDDQFSTTSVTDSSGAVVERYDYHDYGFPLILDADGQPAGVNAQGLYASKVGNPYLFTGREWDGESKLYHYRTRAYHPGLGRFLQVDSIGVWGDAAQLGNGFGGLAANALRWLDPMGLARNCEPMTPRSPVEGPPGYEWDPYSNDPSDNAPWTDQDFDDFYDKLFKDWGDRGADGLQESLEWAAENGTWFVPGGAYVKLGQAVAKGAGIIFRMGGKLFARLKGNKLVQIVESKGAGIWDKDWAERGRLIEDKLGRNLPRNFETIDRFENGVATSIKSVDLSAKTYSDASKLSKKLNGYVKDVAKFSSGGAGATAIKPGSVKSRALTVAVPPGATPAQQAVMRNVTESAAKQGVTVTIQIVQ